MNRLWTASKANKREREREANNREMICSLLDKGHRSEGWLAKRNIARNERENRGRYLSPPFLVRYPSLGPRSCQVIRVRVFCARLAIKYRLECLPSPPPIFSLLELNTSLTNFLLIDNFKFLIGLIFHIYIYIWREISKCEEKRRTLIIPIFIHFR